MKNRHTWRGFTLIELLVVVLIIGILAAVALPQYQKAVEKTQAMKALALLKTIANASQVYQEQTGSFPSSLDKLDVTLPAEFKPTTAQNDVVITSALQTRANGQWELILENTSRHQYFWLIRLSGTYTGSGFVYIPKDKKIACVGKGQWAPQQKWPFCENLLGCSKQISRYSKWVLFEL